MISEFTAGMKIFTAKARRSPRVAEKKFGVFWFSFSAFLCGLCGESLAFRILI